MAEPQTRSGSFPLMAIAEDFSLRYADVLTYAERRRTGRVTVWSRAGQDRLVVALGDIPRVRAFRDRVAEARRHD